jgi:hypothetical protein
VNERNGKYAGPRQNFQEAVVEGFDIPHYPSNQLLILNFGHSLHVANKNKQNQRGLQS